MRSTTPATRTPASSWWRRRPASRWRREGGAHQSIAQPLIGMAQDGLAAFEPAFVDELAAILAFALDYIQKDGDGEASERNWLRDETGGSVYLRLSTRPVEQIKRDDDARAAPGHRRRRLLAARARPELPGGRRLHRRGRARGDPGGRADGGGPPRRRPACGDLGRPAQCRLDRGAARARARPRPCPLAHRAAARRTAARIAASSPCSTAIRRRSAGSARCYGHRTRPLGVEHFGQTGSIPDLYRHYGIDANAIIAAAQAIAPGRPIRHLRALGMTDGRQEAFRSPSSAAARSG